MSIAYSTLQPDETCLTGEWLFDGERVQADDVQKRIGWLVESVLTPVSKPQSGWLSLYKDDRDGRLWELSYPQSEMHGGGPSKLRLVTEEDFEARLELLARSSVG